MKKRLLINLLFIFLGLNSFATTYTVGASGTYTTIAAAYAACSGSTSYIIEIKSDYNYNSETSSGSNTITLGNLSNKSSSNTVTIRPETGVTLSFTGSDSSIFKLTNAKWVIFDGRAGGTGTIAWTLVNSSSSLSMRVFVFQNDASNNTVKYCTIKGDNSGTSTAGGLICFSTSTGSTGNDNNTIDNCYFQGYTNNLNCCIVGLGTTGKINDGNIISNCEFVNTLVGAITIGNFNASWTISGNHFYQSSARNVGGSLIRFIYISNGTGYTISGNYFGGQAKNCGGSPYTILNDSGSGYTWGSFGGIVFASNSSSGSNTISKNQFSNIRVSTEAAQISSTGYIFTFIRTWGPSTYDIDSNTIGSNTGASNIVLESNYDRINYNPTFSAIETHGTGNISITYNTIGGIDYSTTITNNNDYVSLINLRSSGTKTVSNNTIGNSTANNITVNSNTMRFCAIFQDYVATNSLTIDDNIIQNISVNNVSGGTEIQIYGIYSQQTPLTVSNNSIQKLTNNTLSTNTAIFTSLFGLNLNGGGSGDMVIYNNVIANLAITSTDAQNSAGQTGLALNSNTDGKVTIYRNKIRNLSSSSLDSGSEIKGMSMSYSGSQKLVAYNNVVLLKDGANPVSKMIVGIQDYSTTAAEIYHNTVKIFPNYNSGTGITAAFSGLYGDFGSKIVKNNVFQNVSSGVGTHYAQTWGVALVNSPSNIRYNYNEAPDTSKLVLWENVEKSFSEWKTTIGDVSTELCDTISIGNSTGKASSSSVIGGVGTPISDITDDYELTSRSLTNPWIGAFESSAPIPLFIELLDISAKCQKSKTSNNEYGATVKWITASEKNSDYFIVEGSKDGFIWEIKDTIDGSGTKHDPTNYYFHDDFINPTPENETVVYYRVSQTDFDGIVNMYDILSCKCEASDKIKIHPIPSKESIVINFGDQNNVPNTFQITDMFGHIIEDITVIGDKANNTSYTLDISKYASGRYIIKINDWKMKEDGVFIKE